jgi:hypothetical protein
MAFARHIGRGEGIAASEMATAGESGASSQDHKKKEPTRCHHGNSPEEKSDPITKKIAFLRHLPRVEIGANHKLGSFPLGIIVKRGKILNSGERAMSCPALPICARITTQIAQCQEWNGIYSVRVAGWFRARNEFRSTTPAKAASARSTARQNILPILLFFLTRGIFGLTLRLVQKIPAWTFQGRWVCSTQGGKRK